jgi:adenosylcobyric acid synthase
MGSQIVRQGKVYGQMESMDYHNFKPKLKRVVLDSYHRLAEDYDVIVMEGAGSCCEMNLKKNDLVNLSMAKSVGAPCILVGDIDKGGIFAQLIGSFQLMSPKERELTIGFIVNKFRGDPDLFLSGIEYIEKKTSRPIFGLVPFYHDILIDPEDSMAVQEDKRRPAPIGPRSLNIAVLRLPAISNFTDLEVMAREKDVVLNYLFRPKELSKEYDLLILPGTKNVMEDAQWLNRSGWKRAILSFANHDRGIIGICGGYQLLGQKIKDPSGVESPKKEVAGLGLLPVETILEKEKIVRRVTGQCLVNGKKVKGYEIHMGQSKHLDGGAGPLLKIREPGRNEVWEDGYTARKGKIFGTYVHGILDAPEFRGELLNSVRKSKGLKTRPPRQGRLARFHQYDRLADHFEAHCDVDKILSLLSL